MPGEPEWADSGWTAWLGRVAGRVARAGYLMIQEFHIRRYANAPVFLLRLGAVICSHRSAKKPR